MSAFARPVIIDAAGSGSQLERIPLSNGTAGTFPEEWLQKAIYEYPRSLPVTEIDPHIGPLTAICMEVETGAGPADILYLTPTGQLVLVETKLWRNSEARREVVGQILDYAKYLTTWNFDVLERASAVASNSEPGHILRRMRVDHPDIDESSFIDGVNKTLKSGDFLLLIVGDGIRAGAESLVTFLEQFGQLRFSLGLIEVAAYRLPAGQILIQPRILAKTELLQKTLLMGPDGPVSFQQAAQADDAVSPNIAQREWFTAFWQQFLAELQRIDPGRGPRDPTKSTNQYFQMPPGAACHGLAHISRKARTVAGFILRSTKPMNTC